MGHWKLDPGTITQIFGEVDDAMTPLTAARDSFHALEAESPALNVERDTVSTAFTSFMSARHEVQAGLMQVVSNRSGEVSNAVTSLLTGSIEMEGTFEEGSTFAQEQFGFEARWAYNTTFIPFEVSEHDAEFTRE